MTPAKIHRIVPSSLAHNQRATLAPWQRYEALVLRAYDAAPAPVRFKPSGLSAESVVSKVRDAIRGMIAFSYPSRVTSDELSAWWSTVIVRRIDDEVYIGPRLRYDSELTAKAEHTRYEYDTLSQSEMRCFAVLLSAGRINGPITIRKPLVPDPSVFDGLTNAEPINMPDGTLLII